MPYSGNFGPLYGPVIRDKCKTADLQTLKAYQAVANDLLKDHTGSDADDLRASLGDLDKAIKAKGG